MVLNGDSTHPKPWRPPGLPETINKYYQPYPIHQKFPTEYKKLDNWLEDEPFTTNMYYAAKKAVPIGESSVDRWLCCRLHFSHISLFLIQVWLCPTLT